MSGGAEAALEAAILELLRTHEAVGGGLGDPVRVMAAGGDRPAYPHVAFVRHGCEEAGSAGCNATTHRVDFEIVFRDDPRLAATELLGRVRVALSSGTPEIAGQICVLFAPAFWDVTPLSFGGWRGLIRVRAVLEPVEAG